MNLIVAAITSLPLAWIASCPLPWLAAQDAPATEGRASALSDHKDPLALVASDAIWLIDLDIERALKTRLGELLFAAGSDRWRAGIAAAGEGAPGPEVIREFRRITAYGTSATNHPPVVILQGSAAIDQLIDEVRANHPEITAESFEGYEVLGWDDGAALLRRTGDDARLLVIAPDRDSLLRGIAVIDDDAPSALDVQHVVFGEAPREGAFFVLHVPEVDAIRHQFPPGEGEAPRILRLTRAFSMEAGEHAGISFLDTYFAVEREEDAQDIADLAQGLLAMVRLMLRDNPDFSEIEPLLRAIDVDAEGSGMRVLLEIDAARLPDPAREPAEAEEGGDGSG